MGSIFIGHASANNREAAAIRDWLAAQGWTDIFLDFDPARGLAAGERWQSALKSAAERCELVLFLISPEWASSQWCVAEFLLAKQLNKQVFGVIVVPTPLENIPVEMTAEWQLVDLTAGERDTIFEVVVPPDGQPASVAFSAQGLDRLKAGLRAAGLDPAFFPWPPANDPDRPPYPGLRPLEAADAGIFFGRDGPMAAGLELIRGIRNAGEPAIAVILGASGSGKSSFLRAGLLPRLARDDLHFLPLPVVRPERAVLSGDKGFVAALEGALRQAGLRRNRADIRTAVAGGAEGVRALLGELIGVRGPVFGSTAGETPRLPSIVIAVDQAEELFLADGAKEAAVFLALLRDLVVSDRAGVIAIFSIRTDSYERLQTASELEGIRQQFLNLPPMPTGAFGEVIKGPARRLAETDRPLRIDDRLVDALLADIEAGGGKDALPLLAFTLERLYREHGSDGDLTLAEYQSLGEIRGAIEAAVDRVFQLADGNPAIPRDETARLALLRRAFIPWLAGIDPDTGSPRRRIARMSEIPAEARPLVDLLVEQRLLATDRDPESGEVTVEPAHETLLRQWGLLEGWLEEDLPVLTTLEDLRRATRDWAANDKRSEWLIHAGARLADAEQAVARDDLAGLLEPTERAYIAAARRAETERQQSEIAALRRQRAIVIAAAAILAAAAIGLYWAWTVTDGALRETAASLGVVRSQAALRDGDVERAVGEAANALATLDTVETRSAALTALMEVSPQLEAVYDFGGARPMAVAWPVGNALAVATNDGAVQWLTVPSDGKGPVTRHASSALDDMAKALLPLEDGAVLAVLVSEDVVRLADVAKATPGSAPSAGPGVGSLGQHAVDANGDGSLIVETSLNQGVIVRHCQAEAADVDRLGCRDETIAVGFPSAVAIGAEDTRIAVGDEDGGIGLYAVGGEAPLAEANVGGRVLAIDWADHGSLLAVGTVTGDLVIFDTAGDSLREVFRDRPARIISGVRWSPSRAELAFVCDSTDVCLLAEGAGASGHWQDAGRLFGRGNVTGLRWSPDGRRLVTVDDRNALRLWSREENRDVRYTLRTGAPASLQAIALDPSGPRTVAGDDAGRLWIWDAGGGLVDRLDPPSGFVAPVTSVAASATGHVAAAYQGAGVVVWGKEENAPQRVEPLTGARRLTFVGETVAVALDDGRIALLEPQPGSAIAYLDPFDAALEPWGLAGARDGRRLFVSYTDGSIHVWDTDDRTHAGVLVSAEQAGPGSGGASSIAVSADSQRLATTRKDARIVVYDLAGDSPPRDLALDGSGTNAVAFSTTGARLAALGGDGRLYLWDLAEKDAPRIVAVEAVPERSEAGRLGTRQRLAAAMTWIGGGRLAIAAVAGGVEIMETNAERWRARAAQLTGVTFE